MIGEPFFISFINLEMKKLTHTPQEKERKKIHLDTSAEESVRSLILRIASAAAS